MNRFFALLALTGFLLSAIVHVAALAGVDVSEHVPFVWALHAGVFIVFIPFVFSSRKTFGKKPSLSDLRTLLPGGVVLAGSVLFIYAFANFLIFMSSMGGGSPAIRAGKCVLENHGRLVREITCSEYTALRANELRGFSGHWLVFYFAPLAYFGFARKRPSPRDPAKRD